MGGALVLTLLGAASAHAWTWASSTNPIVFTGGGGYGNVNFAGTRVTLQTWARDTRVGDGRVYAKVAISNSRGLFTNLTSGERSDGEPTYARLKDQSTNVAYGTLPGNYRYQVRMCRSATLQDPCSTDYRSYP